MSPASEFFWGGIVGLDLDRGGRRPVAVVRVVCRSVAAAGVAAVGIAALAAPAAAQVTDRTAIDQRLQQAAPDDPFAVGTGTPGSPLGALLLLRERDFFTFAVNGGASYTSNVFLRDKDREDDVMFNLDVSLRAATVVAERFDIFAEVAGFGLRYADHSELNVNGVRGRIGAATKVDGFDIAFTYAPTIAWDDDFDDHLVTLHPLALSVSRVVPVADDVFLIPSLSGGYTFADPSEFAAATATAGITAAWVPTPEVSVTLTPSVSYRHYSDYFESITGKVRKDWNFGVLFGLNYIPFADALLQVAVSGSFNDSSIEPLDHKAFNIGPSVRFSMRF